MSVTRINEFQALEGRGDELRTLLEPFVPTVEAAPGSLSCTLLQGRDNPERLVVIEVWDSVESHQAAVREIPTDSLQAAMALLAAPPRGEYFDG